jgi:hypothetical protein
LCDQLQREWQLRLSRVCLKKPAAAAALRDFESTDKMVKFVVHY